MQTFFRSLVLISIICASTAASNLRAEKDNRVPLHVYTRAFCSGCQNFLTTTLTKLMNNEEFERIIDLNLITAASMELKDDNTLDCEGGPMECTGHRWFSCAIYLNRDNMKKALKTITCLEDTKRGPIGIWEKDILKCESGSYLKDLQKCFSEKSDGYVREMMILDSKITSDYIPYVTVAGKAVGSDDKIVSLTGLKSAICTAYSGDMKLYPSTCPKPHAQILELNDIQADSANLHDKTKVVLQLYWRAYCPACAWFLSGPLPRLLNKAEFRNIVKFEPYPAAGSSILPDGTVKCTSGEIECTGHKWLGCTIHETRDMAKLIPLLSCFEEVDRPIHRDWDAKANKCLKGQQKDDITKCVKDNGENLMKETINKMSDRKVSWMPYILINGKVIGDARHGVHYAQLKQAICDAFDGDKSLLPRLCSVDEDAAEEEQKPVKPCPKKKAALYEDPPDIGRKTRYLLSQNRQQPHVDTQNKSTLIMIVLCILVGGAGVIYHRMTSSKPKSLAKKH